MDLSGKITIHAGDAPNIGEPAGEVLKEFDIGENAPRIQMKPSARKGFTDVFRDGVLIGRIGDAT